MFCGGKTLVVVCTLDFYKSRFTSLCVNDTLFGLNIFIRTFLSWIKRDQIPEDASMLCWLDNVYQFDLANKSSLPWLLLPSLISEAVLYIDCSIKQEKRKDARLYDDSHSMCALSMGPFFFFVLYQLKLNCTCWMCLDSFFWTGTG